MNIYSFPTFNLSKILLTAEELGVDYSIHWLNPETNEHKSPEHLARHPLGKVPTVEIDHKHYFESNSICRLLAERNNNKLYAASPEEKAIINQWVDLATLHLGRWLQVYFFEELVKPNFLNAEADPVALEEAGNFLQMQLPIADQALAEQAFIAGDELSIADFILFSYVQIHELTSINFDAYPKIKNWYESIKSGPAYEKAMTQVPGGNMFSIFANR